MRYLFINIANEEEMESLGEKVAAVLEGGDLVYLMGELGAGKTTLVRGIARGLGYRGRVNSPTFTLMNIYQSSPVIYHFDFYRLEGRELTDLGLEDYLEQEGLALIEWPQAGFSMQDQPGNSDTLPREAIYINIELTDDDYDRERQVSISVQGDRYQGKLEELRKTCAY